MGVHPLFSIFANLFNAGLREDSWFLTPASAFDLVPHVLVEVDAEDKASPKYVPEKGGGF